MSNSDANKTGPDGAAQPPRKLHNLAYGAERLGLIPLRAPIVSAIILAVLCVIAALGLERIKVDDSLSQLFRSDTKEFRQYEEVTKRFPSSEFDVLVVVEGKNLMARGSIEKLRDLVTDLQLVDSLDSRGFVKLKIGQSQRAIADYDAALQLSARKASSLYGRGIAKLRIGDASGHTDIADAKAIDSRIAEEFARYGVR